MKTSFAVVVSALIAMIGFWAAWKIFCYTHFYVTDAIGDAREMRGDNTPTAQWRELIGYAWFYLPGLCVTVVAVIFAVVAGKSVKHSLAKKLTEN